MTFGLASEAAGVGEGSWAPRRFTGRPRTGLAQQWQGAPVGAAETRSRHCDPSSHAGASCHCAFHF